jgi:hypothetical protein
MRDWDYMEIACATRIFVFVLAMSIVAIVAVFNVGSCS